MPLIHLDILESAEKRCSGAVHQDIDLAELRQGQLIERFDVGILRNITANPVSLSTRRANRLHRFLNAPRMNICDHDITPPLGKRQSRTPPDPARPADHHCLFSRKIQDPAPLLPAVTSG